mmetsp:Transcript_141456/g.452155  ORF Transcript_141456/g.452155 Transcript_141456/m.452155 type:complete len:294 (+) Transcript_141456:63-944(+)
MSLDAAPDWAGLDAALSDLNSRVQALSGMWPQGAGVPEPRSAPPEASPPRPAPTMGGRPLSEEGDFGEAPPRRPSVFASGDPGDVAMLDRYYPLNVFAWQAAAGDVGVSDDVSGFQLSVAARLRARQRALDAIDLAAAWRVQRREMEEADMFLDGFVCGIGVGAVTAIGSAAAGRPPPPSAPSAPSVEAPPVASAREVGGAGPLPARAGIAAPAWPRIEASQGQAPPLPAEPRARASTPAEYLDELLASSPQGYAAAVRHLAAAAVAPMGLAGPTPLPCGGGGGRGGLPSPWI